MLRAAAELHRDLGIAFNEKSKHRKELWPATRNGVARALIAIAWFFKRLQGFGAYANVFNEFSTALADLDHGAIHAIFTAKARKGGKGKPPDNIDIMCARCRVAISVAYMMRAKATRGNKRDIAADIAAEYRCLEHVVLAPIPRRFARLDRLRARSVVVNRGRSQGLP